MQDTTKITFSTSKDLQGHEVDLHILGKYDEGSTTNWHAMGSYINDDGVTLDYSTKYNSYMISANFETTLKVKV